MEPRQILQNYALKILGGRRHTAAELRKKLVAKAKKLNRGVAAGSFSPADIESVMERMKKYKYLDDAQYAGLYVGEQLARKPQGIRLLKLNMAKKGLPQDLIAQALANAGPDELSLAQRAAAKKLKSLARQPLQKKKEKLARFLAARGFGTRSIIGVLRSFPSDG